VAYIRVVFEALVVIAVVTNLNGARDLFQQRLLDPFLKLPLRSQIIIAIVWLILAIAPLPALWERFDSGEFEGFAAFFVWPPVWPFLVIFYLVLFVAWLTCKRRIYAFRGLCSEVLGLADVPRLAHADLLSFSDTKHKKRDSGKAMPNEGQCGCGCGKGGSHGCKEDADFDPFLLQDDFFW
jgi:hypothetical protein